VTFKIASLSAAYAALFCSLPAFAEAPATVCGVKADMVGIMLRIYEDGVEKVAGDNKMFVKRDSRDGTLWVIALPNTSAHPALACRTKTKQTELLCTAGEKACASFLVQATERLDKVEKATP
jgi:hypothetical protein